jgi:hypothetical protein
MLNQKQIKNLFTLLNTELKKQNTKGEIGICGGAVMCLVFQCRESTKDIDGIFEPTKEIRKAACKIAGQHNLSEDWLNDAAKGFFFKDPPKQEVLELSNLRIWAPTADYMLAMKCISARYDSHDQGDVTFLIEHLELKSEQDVFSIIQKYYPNEQIPAKTQFLIEELFSRKKD